MKIEFSVDDTAISPEMLRELLAWEKLTEQEVRARLQAIFDDAVKYRRLHRKRHEKALARSIRWGAEYDSYLQNHLSLGRRPKTAKAAARRAFMKAHPLPASADDLLKADEHPGLSAPALRRYHRAYLESLG